MADNNNDDHLIIDVDVVAQRIEEKNDDDEELLESGALNTATGGWAVATAGAGAITTAGAGRVTVCGGNSAGGINTSGAGSVKTYTGVSVAKDSNLEEEEEDCAKNKLPWMVGVLGGLADGAATAAALYKSPRGVAAHSGEVAYRVGIATVLAAGVVEIVAAFWVCGDTQKRGATGKKILYASILTLLLAIALDVVAILHKN